MIAVKTSRFTVAEPVPENRIILFNTLSGSLAVMPAQVWEAASAGRNEDYAREALLSQGFLVESQTDETLALAHWRSERAYDVSALTFLIVADRTLSPSLPGRPRPEGAPARMSRETAAQVLDFVQTDIHTKNPDSVELVFGGGEPWLNPEVVLYLAGELSRFCLSRGRGFGLRLEALGLEPLEGPINELTALGLYSIRVELGGPEEAHDRHWPAVGGGGSYGRIMKNISAVSGFDVLHIVGRYEIEGESHLKFPRLLDDLARLGFQRPPGLSLRPFPFWGAHSLMDPSPVGPTDCLGLDRPEILIRLWDEAALRGLGLLAGPPAYDCPGERLGHVLIDSDGGLGLCVPLLGRPGSGVGDVWSGAAHDLEAMHLAPILPDRCRHECPYAPLCNGGCRRRALEEHGGPDMACRWDEFDFVARNYMRRASQGTAKDAPGR